MDTLALFQRLGLALAIGLLIGIERGWQGRDGPAGSRIAGIRTFALIGLLGGVWAALYPALGALPLGLAFLAFAIGLTAFEYRLSVMQNTLSATGMIAGLLTFALGAYAVLGDMRVAGAVAVAAFALLGEREALHNFLLKVTWRELRAALVLLAMTFVLLPVLPDRAIDPWGALNPHLVWLMTILIAAISYAGYAAVRIAGPTKGLLYAGAVGGLISSTTVTLTYSQLARKQPELASQAMPAIIVSWIVSLLRMTALASLIAPALFLPLLWPVAAAAALLTGAAIVLYRRAATPAEAPTLGLANPFELSEVLRFGALLAAIMVTAKLLIGGFGETGLLPLAAVTGLADVDPITLSVARMLGKTLTAEGAGIAILIAAAANMLTKLVVAASFAGWRKGGVAAVAGVLSIIAGAAVLAVLA